MKKEREYGIRTPFSVPEPVILIPAAKKTSADAIVTSLLSYDDIFLTEGCREKHLALIIRDKIRRAQANEEKSPRKLHT